ncbi:hypothetical protein [Mucilaginibacter sp. OK098]|uniref:hypothetical protein n=1 Tax=Mucilaginibacter sp. OK098 TaxID=1855297 RepID=UPI00091C4F4C|nr:hypothetical protein [Mucilaginibacter sp. OK098]SHN37537.1 hypothetical protein SAMN05216524_1165 [Mucilaginibacter sp. OK098]
MSHKPWIYAAAGETWLVNNILCMLSKVEKIILYSIFGSVPAGLLLFFLYCVIFGPSTREVIIERDLSENVNGVVDTVYNDEPNHNIRTIILKNKDIFQIEHLWELQIEIGDSLYKKKGSFFLEVYKKQGKKIVLDYRTLIPN